MKHTKVPQRVPRRTICSRKRASIAWTKIDIISKMKKLFEIMDSVVSIKT